MKNSKLKKSKKRNQIIFIQHNIGSVEYNINKNVYFKDFKGNSYLIKNKRNQKSPYRDFLYYYYFNKCINNKADIFLLQEVQYGNTDFNDNDYNYYINYIVSGHVDFCDENENNTERIYHGCLLAINKKKFNIIEGLKNKNINIRGKKYRTSDYIIIKDKITNKLFCILTLHGPICDMSNIDKIKTYYNFFYNIIEGIQLVIDKYGINNINFIITGDFNINLFDPDFNPFDKNVNNENDKTIHLEKLINDFINNLKNSNLEIINYKDNTAFGQNFKEKLDFIILSKNLISKFNMEKVEYYSKNKVLNLGDLNYLFDDFDHTKLIGTLNF